MIAFDHDAASTDSAIFDWHQGARRGSRGRLAPWGHLPRERQSRRRQDDARASVRARGFRGRRGWSLHHALGVAGRAPGGGALAWLVARRRRPFVHVEPGRAHAHSVAIHDVPPLRGGAAGDDERAAHGGRSPEAGARRVRLAFGDPTARPGQPPLPPPNPGAEAAFPGPRLHGAPARRSQRGHRQPRRESGARGARARAPRSPSTGACVAGWRWRSCAA